MQLKLIPLCSVILLCCLYGCGQQGSLYIATASKRVKPKPSKPAKPRPRIKQARRKHPRKPAAHRRVRA